MKVLFLLSDYVLHNSLLTDYVHARPAAEVAVIKIPLVLKGKGRRASAERILPQLSKRFLIGKLVEYASLLMITAVPKLLARGPSFRRLRRSCRKLGLRFHRTENVMDEPTLDFVREFAPDVVVSLCHQILKQPLIGIPKYGIVNVHPGALPDYRGIQPYFWELSEGSKTAGATLHMIEDEQIDTGGILAETSFPIEPGMSVQLNYYLTIRSASAILPSCLDTLVDGRRSPRPQAQDAGHYYRWPDSQAFDRLKSRGHTLISLRQLTRLLIGSFDDFKATSTP